MAKGIGLIGNFRGKVGNMVGYNLKDSNNKQTQGVRVYQPVVKNPKTYGQAEQRAKLAPINATYRALKAIIDRGQEGKAYGNKSRLAWLSDAMKAFNGAWFEKGAAITAPALVPLTKGSLAMPLPIDENAGSLVLLIQGITQASTTTIGALSTILISNYPTLRNGDQITFVVVGYDVQGLVPHFDSIVLNSESTDPIPSFLTVEDGQLGAFQSDANQYAQAIVISREGENGAHLRSTSKLIATDNLPTDVMSDTAKEAAIKSYMAAGANTDWAEESLQ